VTAQDPSSPLPAVVPNARGGEDKTTSEMRISLLLDLDPQQNAEGWSDLYKPVIVDLPSSTLG